MPLSIQCPACDAGFNVPDDFAGRKVRCKNCSAVFVAGAPKAPPPKPAAPKPAAPKPAAPKPAAPKPVAANPVVTKVVAQPVPRPTPRPAPAPAPRVEKVKADIVEPDIVDAEPDDTPSEKPRVRKKKKKRASHSAGGGTNVTVGVVVFLLFAGGAGLKIANKAGLFSGARLGPNGEKVTVYDAYYGPDDGSRTGGFVGGGGSRVIRFEYAATERGAIPTSNLMLVVTRQDGTRVPIGVTALSGGTSELRGTVTIQMQNLLGPWGGGGLPDLGPSPTIHIARSDGGEREVERVSVPVSLSVSR